MKSFELECGSCGAKLSVLLPEPSIRTACASCGAEVRLEIFPALFRRLVGAPGEQIVVDGQSSCFYHPAKKASVHCEQCGRFLCAMCDVDFAGQHLCPSCIEAGAKKGKNERLREEVVCYDHLALAIAFLPIVPVFTFYLTILTAPIALYYSVRYWNAPLGVTSRSRWRFVVAIFLALAEIAIWAVILVFVLAQETFAS